MQILNSLKYFSQNKIKCCQPLRLDEEPKKPQPVFNSQSLSKLDKIA